MTLLWAHRLRAECDLEWRYHTVDGHRCTIRFKSRSKFNATYEQSYNSQCQPNTFHMILSEGETQPNLNSQNFIQKRSHGQIFRLCHQHLESKAGHGLVIYFFMPGLTDFSMNTVSMENTSPCTSLAELHLTFV